MRKAGVLFAALVTGCAIGTVRFLCLPDTVDPRGPKGK